MFNEWWLARDTDRTDAMCYPTALTNIRAYSGCVEIFPTKDLSAHSLAGQDTKDAYDWGYELSLKHCKRIFGHYPKEGQLLRVKKARNGKWVATIVKKRVIK